MFMNSDLSMMVGMIKNSIYKILAVIPDYAYLKIVFFFKMRKRLNLEKPKTFNEKLQWLKLYDRNELYTKLVDKYEVKKYVSSLIGEEYIVPTFGVYDSVDDIIWENLPQAFVLKCSHDSGSVVVCKDKETLDKEKTAKKLNYALSNNYYQISREWPYKNVTPRIIVEEYLCDTRYNELRDYKFFCFSGEPKLMYIATNRGGKGKTFFDFYDMQGKHLELTNHNPNAPIEPQLPESFEKMKDLARKLAKNLNNVRIDFYEIEGKPIFGEYTFYHMGGMHRFIPEIWDDILGDYVRIPN